MREDCTLAVDVGVGEGGRVGGGGGHFGVVFQELVLVWGVTGFGGDDGVGLLDFGGSVSG